MVSEVGYAIPVDAEQVTHAILLVDAEESPTTTAHQADQLGTTTTCPIETVSPDSAHGAPEASSGREPARDCPEILAGGKSVSPAHRLRNAV